LARAHDAAWISVAMFPQVNVRDAELAMELWTTQLQESMSIP
jgi:hypothetical protein